MRFNISYLGPLHLAHLRRDFLLLLKYGLERAGHRVDIGNGDIASDSMNIIIGAYFRTPQELAALSQYNYISINTEPFIDGHLNGNPQKTDMDAYVQFMRCAKAAWDVIPENISHYKPWDIKARFMRWGFCPELEEIPHKEKDLDWYFFGTMSKRRKELLDLLPGRGLYDGECTYLTRNDRISRAKVSLNLIQADKYTHVNSFRVCYLMQNRQCVLSEHESDDANYLGGALVSETLDIPHFLVKLINGDWRKQAERGYRHLAKSPSQAEIMEELLD